MTIDLPVVVKLAAATRECRYSTPGTAVAIDWLDRTDPRMCNNDVLSE